jgi:hypothetical protein
MNNELRKAMRRVTERLQALPSEEFYAKIEEHWSGSLAQALTESTYFQTQTYEAYELLLVADRPEPSYIPLTAGTAKAGSLSSDERAASVCTYNESSPVDAPNEVPADAIGAFRPDDEYRWAA